MRIKQSFLYKKLRLGAIALLLSLGIIGAVFVGLKIFAAPLADEARVNENDQLTYYITVNSDGIDHNGITSSDSQISDEVSGITTVTDKLPDGLTFGGFVASSDGKFGAVQRDDQTTMCAGKVIDDTNEEGVESGVWNADNSEYTYHGLHYNAATRTVSFRTKGIGAGCELTVGVITRTPELPEGVFRMDFYDHASFVDESLFGDSNTVHAWIQKDTLPGEYWLSYRYDGVVPDGAPAVPQTSYYDSNNASITVADAPTLEGYTFEGWYYYNGSYNPKTPASGLISLPGKSLELFGSWSKDGEPVDPSEGEPEKYDVVYEVDGEKPGSFNIPAKRSYYEGASVEVDSTKEGDNYDGYDFSGWTTNDVALGNDDVFAMPSKKVTLRGSFEQESYTVSYEFVGDVIPDGVTVPEASEHNAGDIITVASVPSASGYTFSGWYADPSFEMPARDVVIQGEWTKDKTPYAPGIEIEITNPQDEYRKGDTVQFKITVTNDSVVDLSNVWLEELLDGAIFVPGDDYTIQQSVFADIASIPAGGSAVVYAEFPVTKNIEKIYTNTVELIALDFSSEDYTLPDDWNNTASVDFATVVIPDEPVDSDDGPEEKTPVTYDGLGKMVASGMVLAGGLGLCVVISQKMRRGGIIYGYFAAIMSVSGFAVVLINGGFSFADNLIERPVADIYSSKLNYSDGNAGSWNVHESAEWTGEGEATLTFDVRSRKISDLHNKDVILVLDNSNWTNYALDGSEPDREDDRLAIDVMKSGAAEFAEDLLSDGDSRIIVMPTWGDNDSFLTDDLSEVLVHIDAIHPSSSTNYDSYSVSYDKILEYLDFYEASEDRALSIVFVSDDHFAESSDIAKYRMIKSKAPSATVSGIGLGVMESMGARYVSGASADANNVARWWYGVEGNLYPIGSYSHAVNGLDKITGYHENPWANGYTASLVNAVDTSLAYSKFNIETTINTTDFEIRGIFGNVGDIDVNEGVISWTNEEKGLVSGANYKMKVLLKAKDESVAKHKLYQLNTQTSVETDASDIEADSVSSNQGVVLMNGYELTFDINSESTCSLGNNENGHIFLAFQKMNLDEEGVSCDGWNFDSFKNGGLIYGAKNDKMPASDMELKATWRKVDVEVHMDGTVHSVAPAVLMSGRDFNEKLAKINSSGYLLKKAEGCPQEYMDENHRISDPNSPTSIYAWRSNSYSVIDYNYNTGEYGYYYSNPTYYCTDADTIKMNEDSSFMFARSGYSYYDDDDVYHSPQSLFQLVDESIADWDASGVKNMEHMFDDTNLGAKTLDYVGSWNTSNVENMDYLLASADFYYAPDENEMLSGWDTKNVKTMQYLFYGAEHLEKLTGIRNWDTSSVTDLSHAFAGIKYTSNVDMLDGWDTSSVKSIRGLFQGSAKDSGYRNNPIDYKGISGWDLSSIEDMSEAFELVNMDLKDIADWDVSNAPSFNVDSIWGLFESSKLSSDGVVGSLASLSGWTVSNSTSFKRMFKSTNVTDLSGLTEWKITNAENLEYMFAEIGITDLTGLEKWVPAKVTSMQGIFMEDTQLTDLSKISSWGTNTGALTDLSHAFRGTSANDLTALSSWDTSKVTTLAYTFCGATLKKFVNNQDIACNSMSEGKDGKARSGTNGGVKSLNGIQNWNVSSVTRMDYMLAGGLVTDLSPISGWNVSGIQNMEGTFSRLNVEDFSDLSGWNPTSLENMEYLAAWSSAKNLNGLDGWGPDVKNVKYMGYAFRGMHNLESVEKLSNWQTDSLEGMSGLLYDHKKLTSLHGLENWDISKIYNMNDVFTGYTPYTRNYYTNWSQYADSMLSDISAVSGWQLNNEISQATAMFACNNRLTSLTDLSSWRLENIAYMDRMFEGDRNITTLAGLEHWFDNTRMKESKSVSFNQTFAYMSSLQDISALSNWTNNKIEPSSIRYFMNNDTSISNITVLNSTFFNKAYSNYNKANAFDNVPNKTALDANMR